MGYENVYGLEMEETLFKKSPANDRIFQGSILDVSNITPEFDALTVKGVLHHLDNVVDYKLAVANLHKLLVNGGKVHLLEPWPTWFRPLATIALVSPLAHISKRILTLRSTYLLEEQGMINWMRNCKVAIDCFRDTFKVYHEHTGVLYKYICGLKEG